MNVIKTNIKIFFNYILKNKRLFIYIDEFTLIKLLFDINIDIYNVGLNFLY